MLYAYYDLKTKRDYEDLYEEIKAWSLLEQDVFDFGEGEMRIEGWYGSEDQYYKMDLEDLEEYFYIEECKNKSLSESYNYDGNDEDFSCESLIKDHWENNPLPPLHKSHYKRKEKEHLFYLQRVSWIHATWSEYGWDYRYGDGVVKRNYSGYLKRCYAPKLKKYLRKISNRKVRKYTKGIKNGSTYKKVFDLWWELY